MDIDNNVVRRGGSRVEGEKEGFGGNWNICNRVNNNKRLMCTVSVGSVVGHVSMNQVITGSISS